MGHCTFCSLKCPLLNLCFSSSPSFHTNGDENFDNDNYPLSFSEPFDIDISCVFKTLGINYNDETSFPACSSCVVDFQEIEKYFKIISNILNEIKDRRASSPPSDSDTESLEMIDIKEESIDVEEFCQSPQSQPDLSPEELSSPYPEEPPDPFQGETSNPFLGEPSDLPPEELLDRSPEESPDPPPEEQPGPSRNSKDKESGNEVTLGHTTRKTLKANSCSICGSVITDSWRMRVHKVELHGIQDEKPSFRCPTCEKLFTTEHRLNLHRSSKHGDEVPKPKPKKPDPLNAKRSKPCSICGKTFSRDSKLKYHRVEIHGVENEGLSFPCPTCNLKFVSEHRLHLHRKDKHGIKMPKPEKPKPEKPKPECPKSEKLNFECEKCQKTFPARHLFNKHMKTHDPYWSEVIICDICPQLVTRRNLKKHMGTHVSEGNESVKCNLCSSSKVYTRSTLQNHLKKVHEKEESRRKWTCYFCGMTYPQFYYLNRHMTIHTKERPFICSKCGTDFTRTSCLEKHFKSCGVMSNI